MKKKSLTKLKWSLWTLFSIYIRLRDCLLTTGSLEYGECITCGGNFPFNKLQAGHFISGRRGSNLFSERGVHAQCKVCNCIKHGNVLEYRRQIVELYGEGADIELEEEAKQIKQWKRDELEGMIKVYTDKIAELKKEGLVEA